MKFTVTVKKSSRGRFSEKFEKLQKKAKKYGIHLKIISKKEIEKKEQIEIGEGSVFYGYQYATPTKIVRVKYLIIEVGVTSDHIQRENTEYVGTVNNEGGVKQIFNKREDILLHDEKERCDHCETNRYRVKYHFFLENGKLKSIGSSCAKEYFGINIELALQVYEIERNIEDEDLNYFSRREGYSVGDIVAATLFVVKGGDWIRGGVVELLGRLSNPETREEWDDKKEFEEFIKNKGGGEKINEIIKKVEVYLKEKELRTDFDFNMFNSLIENGEIRTWVERGVGIAAYGIFTVIRPEYAKKETKEETKEIKKESEYIGKIGEYFEKEVTVTWTKSFTSTYNGSEGLIIKFEDAEGNALTWFSSKYVEDLDEFGKKVKIKARIKKHEEYNGKKVTYIYYVKVLDWMK